MSQRGARAELTPDQQAESERTLAALWQAAETGGESVTRTPRPAHLVPGNVNRIS